ncbi:hypothetical protein WR25_12853 [Diploscapter pachys]|uniref:EB domain-containing protein n=1 Tax=Diploscapter pachys TaxID=2018661 RepID=A0A2A2JBK5_9BILA|nr:hypothetical protein WR25_12853 [Diploscapter pachys]
MNVLGTSDGSQQPMEQCARGIPLIYPSTKTPVLCQPGIRGCPAGYSCQQAIGNAVFICCSSRLSDNPGRIGGAAPCDDFMVLVTRIIDGNIERRCERSCPYPQIPIGGVCYEMKKNAKR